MHDISLNNITNIKSTSTSHITVHCSIINITIPFHVMSELVCDGDTNK